MKRLHYQLKYHIIFRKWYYFYKLERFVNRINKLVDCVPFLNQLMDKVSQFTLQLIHEILCHFKGEKIENYSVRFAAWNQRVYSNEIVGLSRLSWIIDGLIRAKITPENCPFGVISSFSYDTAVYYTPYLDQFDRGPLFALKADRKEEKKIVFIVPKSYKDARKLQQIILGTSSDKAKKMFASNRCSKELLETVTFCWIAPQRFIGRTLIEEIQQTFTTKSNQL